MIDSSDIIPSKVLAEFVYCPRAGYIEWVEADFSENSNTLDGERIHKRVDRPTGSLGEPTSDKSTEGADETNRDDAPGRGIGATESLSKDEGRFQVFHALHLTSLELGVTAVMDVVEVSGNRAVPVEYRRHMHLDDEGRPPEQDRIQLCVQAMLLQEEGYDCPVGVVYYADSRRRIEVPISQQLKNAVRDSLARLREAAACSAPPPPLIDSPKCRGCSLVEICLPDEVSLLAGRSTSQPRPLIPSADKGRPLYLSRSGIKIRRSHDMLRITDRDGSTLDEIGLTHVSHIGLFGNVQVTTQALRALASQGTTITFMSRTGWLYGFFSGPFHKNVVLRIQQYRAADHGDVSVAIARAMISAKIHNSRTLLMRNGSPKQQRAIDQLKELATQSDSADSLASLLGIEGLAAKEYFGAFESMLKTKRAIATPSDDPEPSKDAGESGKVQHGRKTFPSFVFEQRNRRPPRDPVNALLSYAYSLLLREVVSRVTAVGFDPHRGFYHQPRYGRPSLALDLMEEFRPLVADSVVITAINNGIIKPDDFVYKAGACNLKDSARKRFIATFARRMDQEIRHPMFSYRITYRRTIEVQARILARYLLGDLDQYVGFRTR